MNAPRSQLLDNNVAVMRNRVRVKNGDGSDNSDDDDGKKREFKGHKSKSGCSTFKGNCVLVALIVNLWLCMGIFYQGKAIFGRKSALAVSVPAGGKKSAQSSKAKSVASEVEKSTDPEDAKASAPKELEKDWGHCTENPPQPMNKVSVEKRVEPMWLPAYPTALPGEYSALVDVLTGVANGAKNYYRSSPSLKRCHPKKKQNVDAITCDIVHPIVPCNRPSPAAQADNFGKKVLVSMRNPLTAFFSYHQMKAENYHGQKGQVSHEKWVEFRDEWVGKMLDEWKNFIMEWRNMDPYTVAEYMPYENWLDEEKGPQLVESLSRIFKQEGYPVLYDFGSENGKKDVGCLWHKHIYEPLSKLEKQHAEEGWYVPDFTQEQLDMLASELEKFASEIKARAISKDEKNSERPGDANLIAILKGYENSVRARMQ